MDLAENSYDYGKGFVSFIYIMIYKLHLVLNLETTES